MAKRYFSKDEPRKRIVLIDDHPVVRDHLAALISRQRDLACCGEASNADEALRVIERAAPDVAVVDLVLKGPSGFELIREAMRRWRDLRAVVFSMKDEPVHVERALRAGARGFVSKTAAPAEVIAAIRQVLRGDVYLEQDVAPILLRRFTAGSGPGSPEETLSDREFEVFQLIRQGISIREIASIMHISSRTVEAHREHIRGKLNLKSSADLLRYAIQSENETPF